MRLTQARKYLKLSSYNFDISTLFTLQTGPPQALQQPEGVQPVAQVRRPVHAHVPTLSGDLPVDRQDRHPLVPDRQRHRGGRHELSQRKREKKIEVEHTVRRSDQIGTANIGRETRISLFCVVNGIFYTDLLARK